MKNGLYYFTNPGAALRHLFPKQLHTQALIIIWTIVFLLNIVVVVLLQNFAIYKVTDVSKDGLAQVPYFKNCEVQEVTKSLDSNTHLQLYCITYVSKTGEARVICLESFPVSAVGRFRIKESTDCLLDENGLVQYKDGEKTISISKREYVQYANPVSGILMFMQVNSVQKLAGIYIAIGLIMLGIEFYLYRVFHRLFRESDMNN